VASPLRSHRGKAQPRFRRVFDHPVQGGQSAAFLATRPAWLRWRRRVTGTLLAIDAIRLAVGG
jgi:hypothetical protein